MNGHSLEKIFLTRTLKPSIIKFMLRSITMYGNWKIFVDF